MEIKETKWVIMDKTRTVIAKGVPRNRCLVLLSDTKDKKRILFYSSEGQARSAYNGLGFYTYGLPKHWDEYDLEHVEVEVVIREKTK